MGACQEGGSVIQHLQAVQFKGGMGRPPTKTVKLFASILEPMGYIREYVVRTAPIKKELKGMSLKDSYNIDFANPKEKIAIELDGPSHNSMRKKLLDEKKTMVLEKLGWKVIRIKHN